jgi:hypothetical protein
MVQNPSPYHVLSAIIVGMTPEENKEAWAEYDERLALMMKEAHSVALYQLEPIKLRISHHEKLAGLCAGTLALSITAATAFHPEHKQLMTALPSLLHAWELLMVSIALAVVSNWLTVTGMANLGNWHFTSQIGVQFSLVEVALKKLAPEYAANERSNWDKEAAKGPGHFRMGNFMVRSGAGVGFAAQVIAFCGFVSLFLFAKSMLLG